MCCLKIHHSSVPTNSLPLQCKQKDCKLESLLCVPQTGSRVLLLQLQWRLQSGLAVVGGDGSDDGWAMMMAVAVDHNLFWILGKEGGEKGAAVAI
ncbi:hypothetical protein LOK49_LG06G01922 [Camellia lanceoleosa]|uniref:Uncharacterized protein n=1 Tax=Camellia lanceoleosa TaxID=1840588 RepID=A0ACC0HH01_9ERIC|nr:hypothetical protein LOK49_LG06G01922 [Camellia lanceoleosa]